ncbi:MAG: response regulator transcription factor [Armatimonadetes bacterium]|nr:response regulator transcription factor [Armatimonadota bacterium]
MIETQRILVVDDDFEARLLIARMLEASGYVATAAADAEEAIAALRGGRFDLVLLDVLLPDFDGFECCRRVRDFSHVPIIMVTALNDTKSIVRGLETGADDYIAKPFDREELVSRIRAVLRRANRTPRAEAPLALPPVTVGPLRLDFSAQLGMLGEIDLNLSGKEFLLLYTLASHYGTLLSRAHIFQAVWGDDVYDDSKTLDVHISRLRKKLDVAGGYGVLLKTIRNRGYMLSSEIETVVPPSGPAA